MSDESHLTDGAKTAIRKYMLAIVTIPGIVLSIVAFAMGYLINDIAKQAAYHDAYRDASNRIMNLSEQVAMTLSDAKSHTNEIEEIQGKLIVIDKEADDMRTKIKNAKAVAEAYSNTQNVVQSVKSLLVQDVEFANSISASLVGISSSEDLFTIAGDISAPDNKWSSKIKKVGYGNGVHEWKHKSTSCPEGYYVSGIEVTHGGTCHHQCDPDGAVIREIKLVCRGI